MSAWLHFSEPLNNKLFQLRMAINDMRVTFMLLHAIVYALLFLNRRKEMAAFVC
jgi:hypothetical protein